MRTLSVPTEHVKSEEDGRRTSEPLDSLIGGVLVNQRSVWEGGILCALWFSTHSVPSFPVVMLCCTGMRQVVMSVQDEIIESKESRVHKPCLQLTQAPPTYCISRKRRTYTLLWSWQHDEAVCSMQLFCQTGQTRSNRAVG